MGMLFRMLAPRPVKRARRMMHPVSLMTPRSVSRARMGVINATHPAGALKRSAKTATVHAVRGSGRTSSGSGWGALFMALLVVALVIYGVLWGLSVPGHALSLTPSGHELFNRGHVWLNAHYAHIVWGYIATAVILGLAIAAAIAVMRDQSSQRMSWAAGAVGLAVVLVLTVPSGPRSHVLPAAQAAGVKTTPVSTAALRHVSQTTVREHYYASGWHARATSCGFAHQGEDFFGGKTWNYNCSVTAHNPRLHRTHHFIAPVECSSNPPTASSCSADEYDLKRQD
jgi:hypothetical protein